MALLYSEATNFITLFILKNNPMTLARFITSRAQISSFSDEDLLELDTDHDIEIFKLSARYEEKVNCGFDPCDKWLIGIKRSIKVLRLHQQWIKEERANRRKEKRATAIISNANNIAKTKQENSIRLQEVLLKSHELKLQRISESNTRDKAFIAALLGVIKSTFGQDIYNQIIEAVKERVNTTEN